MLEYSLIFPGQGSQFVGMGKDLAAQSTAAKQVFDEADDILEMELSRLCFEGPTEELNSTANTQPAVFATSYAALKVLQKEFGQPLQPIAVAGHSLGEYTALAAAGSLSFADSLKLVQTRGILMQSSGEKTAGGMIAVIGADISTLTEFINKISETTNQVLAVANDNCPGQIVISGGLTALREFENKYKESSAKLVKRLPISVACHTPLMADAQKEFDTTLAQTAIKPAGFDIIANTSAKSIHEPQEIRKELTKQLCGQVLWTQTNRYLGKIGCHRFVEIGPKKVLCGLTKRTLPQAKCISFSNMATLESVIQFLQAQEE
ncbi:MAG: ACP S-malonyltransferase [Anaerolineaceae bacterium]|nr:ACP S-malonyltransferase [Anaerolineaceae bacterium]